MTFLVIIAAAYLYGSINLSVLLCRRLKHQDIRESGTGSAGTASTARTLGIQWAALVFFFDLSKSVLPLMLLSLYTDSLVLQLIVSVAAILGHCRPLFFQFRGGGGVVTAMGVFFYLVPAEFAVSLAASFLFVRLVLSRYDHPIGQWVPIVFFILTPAVTLLSGYFPAAEIAGPVSFGGKPWYLAAAVLGIGICIMLLNMHVARSKIRETAGHKRKK